MSNRKHPDDLESVFSLARQAAIDAGEIAVEMRGSSGLSVSYKAARSIVTSADIAAEKLIVERIRKEFPAHNILSEEGFSTIEPEKLKIGPWWIIDPVDGTTNYARGHLHVGVSIAFAADGVVQCGVVHAPFLHETYTAIRSKGAWLNGERIHASEGIPLHQAVVATGFPYVRDDVSGLAERVRVILGHCQDLRRLGACSLDVSWVASGRLDAFYETVSPWDMAAAALVAREAGAYMANLHPPLGEKGLPPDLDGQNLFVAAPGIFEELKELLSGKT
jgi:myo-inositol-1(or 4)-monophosphatase